jgi:drug/metabolite transporter (DMT)-like permease
MHTGRTPRIASWIVAATGALWGLYWFPARRLAEIALPGAWGALAIVAAALVLLAPLALRRRRELADADPWALASVALGGVAFVLYSVGFVYARVAIVILLVYLTPVWSTLIERYVMGWHLPRRRAIAIAIGLAGLVVMLAGDGAVPVPCGPGEWLALLSGIVWSIATTGIRTKSTLGPVAAAREAVPQRALVHAQVPRHTPDALPLLKHENLRAREFPNRQLRHPALPSTRNVPGRRKTACGTLGVP